MGIMLGREKYMRISMPGLIMFLAAGLLLAGCGTTLVEKETIIIYRPHTPEEEQVAEQRISVLKTAVISDETLSLSGGESKTGICSEGIKSELSGFGFRIIEPAYSISYTSSPGTVSRFASANGLDFVILCRAESAPVDKFGNFYSFGGDLGVKIYNTRGELVTERNFSGRGERELVERKAAESALANLSPEAASHVLEALVSRAPRLLVSELQVSNIRFGLAVANRIGNTLSAKAGIEDVSLKFFNRNTRTADFEVIYSTQAKEDLVYYIENLPNLRIRVLHHTPGYIEAEQY